MMTKATRARKRAGESWRKIAVGAEKELLAGAVRCSGVIPKSFSQKVVTWLLDSVNAGRSVFSSTEHQKAIQLRIIEFKLIQLKIQIRADIEANASTKARIAPSSIKSNQERKFKRSIPIDSSFTK